MKKINKRKFDTVILDPNVKDEVKMIDKYNDKNFKEKLASFGIAHKLNIILEGYGREIKYYVCCRNIFYGILLP